MVNIQPLVPALGAVVDGIDFANPSDLDFEALHAALMRYGVVFARDQNLAPAQQLALAARFGETLLHPAYRVLDGAVSVLESTTERPSKIDSWHSDMTFEARPPLGSILHAKIIPSAGGDTLWASMYRAYDALSAPLRQLMDGLTGVHDFAYGFRESLAEPGGWDRLGDAVRARPPVHHPAVRTHPVTGRKALYVNELFTTGFVELSRQEGDALLTMLIRHMAAPEFTVRWSWRPGDVAIWDNRCTQHRPVNDYVGHRRLHRVTIKGGIPC